MKSKKLRLGLLLLVVAIIGWFSVVRGQLKVFSDNVLQVKVKETESTAYTTRLDHVKTIKSAGSTTQNKLTAYFLAMPRLSQVPEVLVMIESIGTSSGIVFNSVSVGTPDGSQVPVSVSFTGSVATTSNFLDAVYNNVRTAIVKSQTITSDRSGNLTYNIQLGLIYQGQGE